MSHYVKERKDIKYANGDTRRVYYCHRSGTFKSRSKGVRRLKVQGSCKIGCRCPAAMVLRIKAGGIV